MSESNFSRWLRDQINQRGVAERIENVCGAGTPDICFLWHPTRQFYWIELKFGRCPELRDSQRIWFRRRIGFTSHMGIWHLYGSTIRVYRGCGEWDAGRPSLTFSRKDVQQGLDKFTATSILLATKL